MTPERWAAAQELFEAALALPDAARAAYVDSVAADSDLATLVHGLLAADAQEHSGDGLGAVVQHAMVEAAGTPRPPPERLGPYKIVRMIGEGGMGAVYLAERDDDEFLQQVAIKMARGLLDPERVRQFRTERQILAWLEHPNIARLLDGGTTADGLPYLVMEHVEGVPIDTFCDQARLDVAGRLRLFLDVCDAVSHAHRSLIVHRDIKPGNIMVTSEGVPKLLDFGIARLALDGRADHGPGPHRMMTPFYASPEVVRGGQVTTSADVYALGVLLHELLTGTRPLRFRTMASEEVERVVCHVDPRPPSLAARDTDGGGPPPEERAAQRRTTPAALSAALAGDLDAMVARALHKDPASRYASVEALAGDVRSALEARPVSARPRDLALCRGPLRGAASLGDGRGGHRGGGRQRRRRRLLGAGGAARRGARSHGPRTRYRAAGVALPDRALRGLEPRRHRHAAPRSPRASCSTAAPNASMPTWPASRSCRRGCSPPWAWPTPRRAPIGVRWRCSSARSSCAARPSAPTTSTPSPRWTTWAEAYRELSLFDEAESMHREALAAKRRLGAPPSSIALSLNNVGLTLSERGRFADAEPLLREAIDIWRQHDGTAADVVAAGLNNLADVLRQQARLSDAVPLLQEAIEIRRQTVGSTHPSLALVVGHLGRVFSQQGELTKAEPLLREALSIRQRVYGDDHPDTVNTRNDLTSLLHDQGDLAGAEPLYRAAVSSLDARLGRDHVDYAVQINNLASVLEDQRRFDEAERLYRESLAIRLRHYDPGHQSIARARHNLARTLLPLGRVAEAEELVRAALAARQQVLPAGHFETALSKALLGKVLAVRGRASEAEPLLVGAVADLRAAADQDPKFAVYGLMTLSELYRSTGHPERAEPAARDAAARAATLPAGHWQRAVADVELASALADLQRRKEAAQLLRPAIDVLSRRFGEGDARVREARGLLASLGP